MSEPNGQFGAAVTKHLEFIQAVISRQAGNSFLIKGWSLTLSSALYGFAVSGSDWRLACVGLAPALGFWGLDGYFLRQERLFRCLYDEVRNPSSDVDSFCMNPAHHTHNVPRWRRVAITPTLSWFYLSIVALGLLIALVVGLTHHGAPSHRARTKSAIACVAAAADVEAGGHISPMASPFQRGTTCR